MPTKTPAKPKKKPAKARVPNWPPKGAAPAPEPPAAPREPEAPPATTDPAEEEGNALQMVLKHRVQLNDVALVIAPETTFEEWREVYSFVDKINERGKWWLGDIINWAEDKIPDRYTQAIEMTGLGYSRLTTIVSVAKRIEPARRRKEAPFSYHELIAYLPYQNGDHLLDRAIKEKWTHEQLADAVARSKGEPTKAERKAAKEAKVLPKKANTEGPTLDGHLTLELEQPAKPLMWNGYALTTKDREVYQGPEKLTTEEADRAAHHHDHAHAAALMNWLEEHNFRKEETTCAQSPDKAPDAPAAQTPKASDSTCPTAQPEGASNGASVVQPDAAPKIAGKSAMAAELEENPPKGLPVVTLDAPAAPPTPSEEPFATLEPMAEAATVAQSMAPGYDMAIHSNPDARAWAAFFMETKAKTPTIADSEECMIGWFANAMMAMHDHMEGKRQREEAAKTHLERAEAAILAFNAAAADVDAAEWQKIGESTLLRKKWLGNLLAQADIVIDKIQGHKPTPRK